jgi:hypothetical protein
MIAAISSSVNSVSYSTKHQTLVGGGLRVLFNKRSRTNFCIDVAYGKAGAQGVYFAIQDAF